MPNSIEAAIPLILSTGLTALRESCVMPMLVNSDYSSLAQTKGSSVDVVIPSGMGDAEDMIPGFTTTAVTDLAPTKVPIILNRWKKKDFVLTDTDLGKIINGYISGQVTEAARSIANTIDKDLLALYRFVYGFAGQAGQTPFQNDNAIASPLVYQGLGASRDARKILNRQLALPQNRRMVLDVEAEANASALPAFANAQYSGDPMVIRDGIIGTKQGFDWFMDQNVGRHVLGAAGTFITSAVAAVGATTLAVSSGTTAPVAGDVFTIAGQTQSYVILAGSTLTAWNISPALRVAVPASSAITFIPSHTPNLAFHRDAFAFAMRPLDDVIAPGSRIETYTDDVTGLVMRLEIMRQSGQTMFRFDVLYGCACVRPQLACRVLGA
jgi:P22 coat protein - gene protein 5